MREKTKSRIPLIGVLLSVMAVFMLLSFNKIVSSAAEGDYLTFTAQEDSKITFYWVSGSDVQTSTDGGKTWSDYIEGTTINLAKNSSISFRANNIKTNYDHYFQIQGKVSASGDVTSLTNGKGGDCELSHDCYSCMFAYCEGLISAPKLPATTLQSGCYSNMFYACGLTSIPELPATTLAADCYTYMFASCVHLIIKTSGPGKEWSIPAEAASSSVYNLTRASWLGPDYPESVWCASMFEDTSSEIYTPEAGVTYYIASDTSYLAEIESFVTRLYKVCLDREPDDEGLNNWVNDLANGDKTGVDVASGFIFSTEFSNHNYCNSCYVEHLYNAFMGRASDPDGKAYWINKLETGMTREEVFNGFALSPEFKNICDEYGIVQGEGLTIPEYGTVPKGSCSADGTVDGVTSFVTRLYNVCLDRDPDAEGLNNWTNALWNHERSGSEIASGFIFSQEFTNKNYDDETYVEYLYRAFFDRASDPTGKADWVSKLQNGATREEVFNGFTGSQEFMTLCAKYGIVR